MQRSAMRELAFKLVYGLEIQKESQEDTLDIFYENNNITDENVKSYLKNIKEGIEEHKDEINRLIESNLKDNWSLNRISKINISLIKIAIYEMIYNNVEELKFKLDSAQNEGNLNEAARIKYGEIPEVGIIKLIHDNYHEFKPRNKKIKFNSNIIRNISQKIKELQNEKYYEEIRSIIHKIKIDNWKNF